MKSLERSTSLPTVGERAASGIMGVAVVREWWERVIGSQLVALL